MLITDIEIFRFSIPMHPFTIATGTMEFAQNMLIKIFTDKEIVGLGEASAFPMIVGESQETMLIVAKELAKIWKGKNPLAIEERLSELQLVIAGNHTCKSAFDMALYDIAAKNAGLPLYQFLGGNIRKINSDITVGISSPAMMAQQAKEFQQTGWETIKVKLGKNVADDIERVKQIREAVGKNIKLRLDANQGWTYDDALFALKSMANYDIEFCEQPMRTWYDDLLPDLVQQSPIKIMADESCYNHHDARKLINNKGCDYVNIKFSKSGGINEALKIYDTCQMYNVKCMIGGMLESRLALSAKVHFALAAEKIEFFDLDTCLLGHKTDPIKGGVKFHGSELIIGDEIGIGADVEHLFLEGCEHWLV